MCIVENNEFVSSYFSLSLYNKLGFLITEIEIWKAIWKPEWFFLSSEVEDNYYQSKALFVKDTRRERAFQIHKWQLHTNLSRNLHGHWILSMLVWKNPLLKVFQHLSLEVR